MDDTIVRDSTEEVKMTCHFFYIIGVVEVRILGFIYYFELPNSLNERVE